MNTFAHVNNTITRQIGTVRNTMNSYNVLWFLILNNVFDKLLAQSDSTTGNSQSFIRKSPIPSDTSAPLDIDSIPVKNETLQPRFTSSDASTLKILNTVRKSPIPNDTSAPLDIDTIPVKNETLQPRFTSSDASTVLNNGSGSTSFFRKPPIPNDTSAPLDIDTIPVKHETLRPIRSISSDTSTVKVVNNGYARNSQSFIGKYPIPSETPAPLDIDTSKVKTETLLPIRFTSLDASTVKVVNNGYAIEAISDLTIPGATVTGGPLQNDIFIFRVIRYYWAGNSSQPAGNQIDGADGLPIEAVAYWYNSKYGSFENSTNYRDGMVGFTFRVDIGPLPSPTFIPFTEILEKVRKSGSETETKLVNAFIWFDAYLSPLTSYFAYPGSYRDQENSKDYDCATIVVFKPHVNYISEKQFEDYLLTLEDSEGNQLINAAPSHPQGDTPVIQAEGVVQIFIPLGDRLLNTSDISLEK